MNEDLVFAIGPGGARPLPETTMAEAGLWERRDLQEWVIEHPQILGDDVKIVAFEFGSWRTAAGDRALDRLDVLGLDGEGRLVVAELKRDLAPETVELQAMKYAAMASRFTLEDLAGWHARQLGGDDHPVTLEEARGALLEHAPGIDTDTLRQPRIVIIAGDFRPSTTATVVWLNEMGLDISLRQVQVYRTPDESLVMTVSQLYPIPDVEDFTIAPQQAATRSAKQRSRDVREQSTVVRLVKSRALADGTPLQLTPVGLPDEVGQRLLDWMAEDPRRGRAVWHNDSATPLEWEADGRRYRPTAIVTQVLSDAVGVERRVRGPQWWTTPDGQTLTEVAGPARRFDWSTMHAVLDLLPAGTWTSYQDLAELAGTASQPVGTHIGRCEECVNGHRVLNASGMPAPGFRWLTFNRKDSQQEALESEGIVFINGRADPAQRLQVDQLRALQA